ncbi:MAG: sulfite exporter TauE/SafE family protein [Candidatus Abyssobacteria bacterium SURF_17]|uniref:Probable membrane transporter protein n=1 Tax=Candidatus Abyssobacteria bacterium SURF_17 TaxID=2093361 RepID=A0A419ETB0_9BACT|nr:MAG: sulfite exporter TauE/SafE family protein [Candidatus Abyssubacteria bacterium SURF_17]
MDNGILDIYLPIAGIHFNILILLAIGFSVGVLGGFFGVGGAWVVTPALNIFGFNMAYAIGTDLAHIFGKSIVATRKHGKMGNVDVKLGLYSIVGSVLGVEGGARTVMWLTARGIAGPVVRYAYMFLLFGLGIYMFYDYFTKDKRRARHEALEMEGGPAVPAKKKWDLPPMVTFPVSGVTVSLWTVLGVFFFTGWLSGFLGVGGGFIRMPALIYLLGCPTAIAVGTDLFSVVFTGAYGCFTYALKARVEIIAAIVMLVGASIGAQLGVTAVKYIHGYGIRLLFAIMIVLAGCSVTLKQFNLTTAAAYCVMGAALAMCLIIIVLMIRGFNKEKALKAQAAR